MRYSISTIPIYEKFGKKSLCALCDLQFETNLNMVEQFLNDAVMEDDIRKLVNEKGFCKEHFDKLYAGQNKLGLALQSHTRMVYVNKHLKEISNVKQAKKQVEELTKITCSCIICELVNAHMKSYVETIPKMFLNEEEFRDILAKETAICLNHYIDLLNKADKAGKYADMFVKTINGVQKRNIDILSTEIRTFCNMYDHRNKGKPMGEEKYSLQKTRVKMYGKKIND